MNTWALSDKAESCDFQLRILKKRTGLGSHPSSPKTIVLQAILEHVRSSELTCYEYQERVRFPPPAPLKSIDLSLFSVSPRIRRVSSPQFCSRKSYRKNRSEI